MRLSRLKWTLFLVLLLFFAFLELSAVSLGPLLTTWKGRLLMDLVALVGFLFVAGLAFDRVSQMHARLERQNRELLALHRAGLDIYGNLSLDTVLQKVVDQAAQLLDARYGAISVINGDGSIQQFITSGLSPQTRKAIGPPPMGRGLLGISLHHGQRLRIADVDVDARSAGFPENHPHMRSLLAVPVLCKGPFRGNLYLADKESAGAFSSEDEETLVRFATAAAIAIDNTYLHQQLRALAVAEERVRIGREMHDGLAQVLAYVNTKAQAVEELLHQGKSEQAAGHLKQLAEAAREVHADVREQIAGLRVDVFAERSPAEALQEVVSLWQRYCSIPVELEVDGDLQLPPLAQLQVLRIVQEALSNVRKHAGATEVRVGLAPDGGDLVIVVEDDGKGFDPAAKARAEIPRFGLAIMRERAESIDATFSLDSRPGHGTRVSVRLPTPGSAERHPLVAG
jgi:signal transduction histidine kinase